MNDIDIEKSATNVVDVEISAEDTSFDALFYFKCYNTTRVAGTSSLTISEISLVIEYTSPNSTFELDMLFVNAGGSVVATITSGDVTLAHSYTLSMSSFITTHNVETDDEGNFVPTTIEIPLDILYQMPNSSSMNATITLNVTDTNGVTLYTTSQTL